VDKFREALRVVGEIQEIQGLCKQYGAIPDDCPARCIRFPVDRGLELIAELLRKELKGLALDSPSRSR
jgi:hypothetical protein